MSEQLPFQIVGKTCGPAPGFIRQLWLVDARQVAHIPDPLYLFDQVSLHVPSRMISFFSDVRIFKMKFVNKTCTFQQGLTRTDSGSRFSQVIDFTISQSNLQNTSWLFEQVHTPWIAFLQDHGGNVNICGSVELPMRLNFSATLAADNSTAVSLSCESAHAAYFLDALPSLERVFASGFGENFG